MRGRYILAAILVAGTLDIVPALWRVGIGVLGFVASGPLGEGIKSAPVWLYSTAGLAVHYLIMTGMVVVYFWLASHSRYAREHPVPSGLLYGVLLWFFMYWVVLPIRWPAFWPPTTYSGLASSEIASNIALGFFAHCILVGVPIALIASRSFRHTKDSAPGE